jgi:hypothetical protein
MEKENNTNGRTTQTMQTSLIWGKVHDATHFIGTSQIKSNPFVSPHNFAPSLTFPNHDRLSSSNNSNFGFIGLPPSIAPAHTTANPGMASGTFISDEPYANHR